MPYKITLPGDDGQFVTDMLTVGEAEWIEQQTGTSWRFIDPKLSASNWRAIAAAWLMRSMPEDEALAKAKGYLLRDVTSGFEEVPDDRPTEYENGRPKAGGGGSTSGSSGRGKRSGGSRTKHAAKPSVTST